MVETSPVVDPVSEKSLKQKGAYTDHLANERTFLAWTRTSLGIFAIGCAIARFGGSRDAPATLNGPFHETKPVVSGLILVAYAILALCYGIYRYYRINRQIRHKDFTDVSQIREPIIATLLLLLCMITILIIFIIL